MVRSAFAEGQRVAGCRGYQLAVLGPAEPKLGGAEKSLPTNDQRPQRRLPPGSPVTVRSALLHDFGRLLSLC